MTWQQTHGDASSDDSRAKLMRVLCVASFILFLAGVAAGCTSDTQPDASSSDEALSRVIGEPGEADELIDSNVEGEQLSQDETGEQTDGQPQGDDDTPDSSADGGDAPNAERGEVVRSDDDITLTEPEPEFVEESISLDEATEDRGVQSPCDLYTTSNLRTQMTEWSQTSGLIADLPNGLLVPGSEIEFAVDTQTPTECSWFSESQLWSVRITFQPVSGFTDELLSRGEPVPGVGDGASIDGDTTGSVEVGDLFVSITNLPPAHTQTSNDRNVLLLMLSDVTDKLV